MDVFERLAGAWRTAWEGHGGWAGCPIPAARGRATAPLELQDFFVAAEFCWADLAAGSADAWDTVRVKMREIVGRLLAWPGRLKRSQAPGSPSADWVRCGDWTPRPGVTVLPSETHPETIQFRVDLRRVGLSQLTGVPA